MIKQIEMYTIYCDKCGIEIFQENEDYSCVASEQIENELEEYNWQEINDKHYCPNCVVFDEETDEWRVK